MNLVRTIVPVGLMGIVLVLAPANAADEKKAPAKKPVVSPAAAKTVKPSPAGMIAVKDADTGQLRAPTAEEAAALAPKQPPQQNSTAGLQTIAGPGGGVGLVLDDSTTVYAVATKNPDGSISFAEATGPEKAKAAVTNPKPAAKKGVANDR